MKARILIVDMKPDALELIETNLKGAGFETLRANNGAQALTQARTAAPALVVLDVMLPEMDGLEICKSCGRRHGAHAHPHADGQGGGN